MTDWEFRWSIDFTGKPMPTFFISGHLDLTPEEFAEHYVVKLMAAQAMGASFIVGDARGADTLAQAWLKERTTNVRVYHMFETPRNNLGFSTSGGFKSDKERDEAMTAGSSHDIAWVRPGRETSGTAKNLARRLTRA
jgi:hypothetical protein